MNWSVERKTPNEMIIRYQQQKLSGKEEQTNEWDTRWIHTGHQLPVFREVLVAIDRHFTSSKLCHGPLIDLLPCSFQSPDRGCIQA